VSMLETIKHECRHCGVINAVELSYQDSWRWPTDGTKRQKALFVGRVTAFVTAIAGGVMLMAIGALVVLISFVLGR